MAEIAGSRTKTSRLVGVSGGSGSPLQLEEKQDGFSADELCQAFKNAWKDFISGKTNRKAFEALTRHLDAALKARKQMLAERERLTSQRCHQFYN